MTRMTLMKHTGKDKPTLPEQLALIFQEKNKHHMAQDNTGKKTVSNKSDNKKRKGDTGRTSSQGRKEASGGSTNTNNQGRPKGIDTSRP
jgi:hypothetical protein